jgi:hypothetical protein
MGQILQYFIFTVMIATFKPAFCFPLTYIRLSIPVSQFPVVVPFLPNTMSKSFCLQRQSSNSKKCSSAIQGEFKTNPIIPVLYLRNTQSKTSTERRARQQADVPQNCKHVLKYKVEATALH